MKKTMLSACFLLVAGNAVANDGTIHFTGSITDQTCTVDSGSQNLNVDLGNVGQTALNGAAGMKASPTRFTLNLVARYVSTGTAVTTGTAYGTSQFTINYK